MIRFRAAFGSCQSLSVQQSPTEHLQTAHAVAGSLLRLGVVDHTLKIDDHRGLIPYHPGIVPRG